MMFWGKVLAIVRKDTISELRTKEVVSSVLVFTILIIIIFNFAFSANYELAKSMAPGILWATFAFAGVLSLNRAFVAEKEQGCLEGLMVCPISRDVIYVGKMVTSLLFMLIIEMVTLPIFTLLFNVNVISLQLIAIVILATIGFVAVGTLFSAIAINTRARELVLPILFLPVVVPVVISAVKASGLAIAGEPWSQLYSWLLILLSFDVIFITLSYLIFSHVIEE
jgi:heme exporter protein B